MDTRTGEIMTEEEAMRRIWADPREAKFLKPVQPYVRSRPKTGRNEPCPCGSGLKFKKCCLGKENYNEK